MTDMRMWKCHCLSAVICMIAGASTVTAQDVINLNNPSFEDIPRAGGVGYHMEIRGWYDCARAVFPDQSPPDIHPHPQAWMVSVDPNDGNTFLGMVVRADETYEFLSQALEVQLQQGKCYDFSIHLAQSDTYMGMRNYAEGALDSLRFSRPFMTPAVLRIWGGSRICKKDELLASSGPVTNSEWKKYEMHFEPESSHRYITLEAFYETPVLLPYNGHILVDNASAILQVTCEEEVARMIEEKEEIINRSPQPEPAPVPDPPVAQGTPAPPPPPVEKREEPVQKEKVPAEQPALRIMRELDINKIEAGQRIRLKSVYFEADSSSIEENSYVVLNELYSFLRANPDVVIEIGGHTNTIPEDWYCDQLSESRAKAVTDYLIAKGISEEQLEYKGYGKRQPLIANDKYSAAAQRKNQRVEITILSLEGD